MSLILNPYRFAAPTPPAGVTLVQQAGGSTGATPASPVTAALSGASTTGHQLLLATCSDATVSTPSGWTLVQSKVSTNGLYFWTKTSAGETNVAVSPGVAAATSWWIAEYSGLAIGSVLGSANAVTDGSGLTSQTTGTTGTTTGATNGLAVAVWGASRFSAPPPTVSAMSNGFAQQADVSTTSASRIMLAAGTLTPVADGTFSSTVTLDAGASATSIGGLIVVFAAL